MSRGIEGRLCEEGEHQRHFVVPSFPSVENAVGRVSFSAIVTGSVQSRKMGLLGSQVTEMQVWGNSSSPSIHLPANYAGLF